MNKLAPVTLTPSHNEPCERIAPMRCEYNYDAEQESWLSARAQPGI